MSRLPRLELPQWPHLVMQSAAPGERLFRNDEDMAALCGALLDASRQHGLAVHAYVLREDGLDLLVTPPVQGALSLFMQAVGRRYVAGYNRRHARQGGLWAGRFRATVLDPARYLLDIMVHIESQPWRAGLVHGPCEPASSMPTSLAHHLGQRSDPLVQDHAVFWGTGNTPFDREAAYRRRMEQGLSPTQASQIEDAARKGWALASDEILAKGQALTPRRMTPRPRGRPRKPADVDASVESASNMGGDGQNDVSPFFIQEKV
jgi:putative transposase